MWVSCLTEAVPSLVSKGGTPHRRELAYLSSDPGPGSVQQPADAFWGQILVDPVQLRPWCLVRCPCLQVARVCCCRCCLYSFSKYAAGSEYICGSVSHGRDKAIVHRRHLVNRIHKVSPFVKPAHCLQSPLHNGLVECVYKAIQTDSEGKSHV